MKLHLLIGATAVAAAMASAAGAAPTMNWTGWYVGLHGGGDFGTSKWSDLLVPEDSGQDIAGPFTHTSPSGGFGGVQGGYDIQSGSLVLGLEGSVSGSSFRGQTPCIGNYGDYGAACRTGIDLMGDVTARVGFTADQMLIYAKGRIAMANDSQIPAGEATVVGFDRIPPGYVTTHDFRWGPTVGGGIEYALTPHWTVGVEYDYRDYGTKRVTFNPKTGVAGAEADLSPVFSVDSALTSNQIEAKVNYRF